MLRTETDSGPTLQSLFLICGSAGSTYFVVYSRQIIIAGRIANPQLNRRRTARYETPLRGYITIIISISQVISRRLSIPQHPIRFRIWQSARCTKQQRTHHYSNLPGEVKQLENHLMLCTDCKKNNRRLFLLLIIFYVSSSSSPSINLLTKAIVTRQSLVSPWKSHEIK